MTEKELVQMYNYKTLYTKLKKENAELKEQLEKETAHRIRNFNKAIEWKEKYRTLKKENAEMKEKLEITDLALDNCLKDSEVEK